MTNSGFTLMETLIAVLLLSTAIVGPLTIASKGLTTTLVAKNQITAFYLAQDAIEQIRFLRDSNCLASSDTCTVDLWLAELGLWDGSAWAGVCFSASGCHFDSLGLHPTQATVCDVAGCPVLYYDKMAKQFTYLDGRSESTTLAPTTARFVRTVKITNTTPDEAVVTVTVSWSDIAGVTRVPITMRENIYLWQ